LGPSGAFGGGNTAATCDIVIIGSSDNDDSGGTTVDHTPPGGYTEAHDVTNGDFLNVFAAYKEGQAAGFDGVLTATGAATGQTAGYGVFVIALQAAAGGGGTAPMFRGN
jgi:hypothetical protein